MPQIRPIKNLRNTNEISEICHNKNEPIFITRNGYGDLVIMSIETYEKQIAGNHQLLDDDEVFDRLRSMYGRQI